MKKFIIILLLWLAPTLALAAINQNLYYGLTNNSNVKQLQQYLVSKGFLAGNATGNFYGLTLAAVKEYQTSQHISATGYVGPLTRQAINADMAASAALPLAPSTSSTTTSSSSATSSKPVPFSGALDILQSPLYVSQSATAPELKFKLAEFSLVNETTEAINLTTLEVDLATGSNLYITNTYVNNLYVVYGGVTTTILNQVSHVNDWSINTQLLPKKALDVAVYGDVNSSIPTGSVINASLLVTGVSATSKVAVTTDSDTAFPGQNITFGIGSLIISQDGAALPSRMVTANQRVVGGKFNFNADGNSYTASELKFIIPADHPISPIEDAVLLDTATQTPLSANPVYGSSTSDGYVFDFTGLQVPVALNVTRSLTVAYDVSATIDSSNTNINIAPVLVYVKATNGTGTMVDGAAADYKTITPLYNGVTLPQAGVVVNSVYLFKSIPTFAATGSSATAANNTNASLYTFSMKANANGNIAVKQLVVTIALVDPGHNYPHLNNFTFFKGTTNDTANVSIATTVNNNYIGLSGANSVGVGNTNVTITFNNEEIIPAGQTQAYTLKAYTNNFLASATTSADSITTFMPGDAAPSDNGSYARMAFSDVYGLSQSPMSLSVTDYNVLWSDMSAVFPGHSDSNGNSTNDWYNGFDVLQLPLPSQIVNAR